MNNFLEMLNETVTEYADDGCIVHEDVLEKAKYFCENVLLKADVSMPTYLDIEVPCEDYNGSVDFCWQDNHAVTHIVIYDNCSIYCITLIKKDIIPWDKFEEKIDINDFLNSKTHKFIKENFKQPTKETK